MNDPQDELAALMARVRLDDNQALAALIALYEPKVRRTAQALLGKVLRSSLDPMDLVQSVHLRLIHGLKQKKLAIVSLEHLRSLAVTLLRRELIQQWRHHRCQARHITALAAASGPACGNVPAALRALDPEEAAEYNDLFDHLCRRLERDDCRLVVMRLEGHATKEIAAELGIDPAVLRVRLSRLRKRLRQEEPLTERD